MYITLLRHLLLFDNTCIIDKFLICISRWFVQMVHGDLFSKRKWETFLRLRAVPGSGVTFAEIEVMLCNIPSMEELLEEEEEERREAECKSFSVIDIAI